MIYENKNPTRHSKEQATTSMNMGGLYRLIKLGRYIFPVLGIAFCMANGLGAELACFSSGCSIYADYSFLGVSFYWYGCAAFSSALLLLILERRVPNGYNVFTLLLLFADIGFLLWSSLFLPCSSCLVVAFLILCCFLSGLLYRSRLGQLGKKAAVLSFSVLAAWTLLFVIDTVDTLRELTKPWSIHGSSENVDYEIWFSLTCPNCEKTLKMVLTTPGMMDNVALYPVSKDEKDIQKYIELYCGLKRDIELKDALEASLGMRQCTWSEQQLDFWDEALLRLRLQWNKALLIRKGYSTVPILVSNKIVILDKHGCQIETDGTGCMAGENNASYNQILKPNNFSDFFNEADSKSCGESSAGDCSL